MVVWRPSSVDDDSLAIPIIAKFFEPTALNAQWVFKESKHRVQYSTAGEADAQIAIRDPRPVVVHVRAIVVEVADIDEVAVRVTPAELWPESFRFFVGTQTREHPGTNCFGVYYERTHPCVRELAPESGQAWLCGDRHP